MGNKGYITNIINTIKYDIPERGIREILKNLIDNNIITYKKEEKTEDKIFVERHLEIKERLVYAINNSKKVISYIEKYLMNKEYRYAIYYKIKGDKYTIKQTERLENIENVNFLSDKFSDKKVIFEETENQIKFRFLTPILATNRKMAEYVDIYYCNLWVYHKNLNVLEYRFNSISADGNEYFYASRLDGQLEIIKNILDIEIESFKLSNLVKMIVENKSDVKEVAQTLGLKKEGKAKLKVGKNNIMPFIGDLEEILEEKKELFSKNEETKEIESVLKKYIYGIKKNAKYKARSLTWIDEEGKNILEVQVIFNYRELNYDLINFQNPKIIDGRMMNYAIEYIIKTERDINGKSNK